MTQQAFETKAPPPEAIRAALLLGLVVGSSAEFEAEDMPVCEECGAQIDKLRAQLFGEPAGEPAGEGGDEAPDAEPASQT
jgi:hypothetical protein